MSDTADHVGNGLGSPHPTAGQRPWERGAPCSFALLLGGRQQTVQLCFSMLQNKGSPLLGARPGPDGNGEHPGGLATDAETVCLLWGPEQVPPPYILSKRQGPHGVSLSAPSCALLALLRHQGGPLGSFSRHDRAWRRRGMRQGTPAHRPYRRDHLALPACESAHSQALWIRYLDQGNTPVVGTAWQRLGTGLKGAIRIMQLLCQRAGRPAVHSLTRLLGLGPVLRLCPSK